MLCYHCDSSMCHTIDGWCNMLGYICDSCLCNSVTLLVGGVTCYGIIVSVVRLLWYWSGGPCKAQI